MRYLFSARALFGLMALFIFYATTIPWDLAQAPSLERVAWIPLWDPARGRPPSLPDLAQNVVLFMPYGFFAVLGFAALRRRGAVAGTLLTGLCGFALSFFVECLQTMSATRNPSASDLTTNTAGALAGGAGAFVYLLYFQDRGRAALVRTARERPGLLVLGAYLAVVSAGALAPFIPTFDVSNLRANVRLFLDDPWGPKPLGALLSDLVLFAALGFLGTEELAPWLRARRWLPGRGEEVSAGRSAALAVLFLVALGLGFEAVQLILIDHSPGLQDVALGSAGALLGAGLAALLSGGTVRGARRLGELTRRRPWLVLGFAVLAPLVRALSPFTLGDIDAKLDALTFWRFVPFWTFFQNINLASFRNVFEVAAFYVPLGYALCALGRSPGFVFGVGLLLAEALELLQIAVAERTYDITEGIYGGGAALFGAYLLSELSRRTTQLPQIPRDDTLIRRPAAPGP